MQVSPMTFNMAENPKANVVGENENDVEI